MDILDKILDLIEKKYKIFVIIIFSLILLFSSYLVTKYFSSGEILKKSLSLSGGYLISFNNPGIELNDIKYALKYINSSGNVYSSGNIIYIESEHKIDTNQLVSALYELYKVNISESSISTYEYSSSVGNIIFNQFVQFLIIAIILSSIAISIRYRKKEVSIILISTLLFDYLAVISILSMLDYPISSIGFIALFLIIGFAIDNNVVLATNMIKETDLTFKERARKSFRIGLLMEAIIAIIAIFLYILVPSLQVKEFSLILIIATLIDTYYYIFGNIPLYKLLLFREEKKEDHTSTTASTTQ